MSDDLEKRLRDLTGMAHSDFTIGEEAADELARLRSDNEALRHDIERQVQAASELAGECARLREALAQMKAATYSHVDGRDLLHELQPNGAHHIDIVVRINGQDKRYQGDWLKNLTHARDMHNMGEYADNPKLRAHIEASREALKGAAKP